MRRKEWKSIMIVVIEGTVGKEGEDEKRRSVIYGYCSCVRREDSEWKCRRHGVKIFRG